MSYVADQVIYNTVFRDIIIHEMKLEMAKKHPKYNVTKWGTTRYLLLSRKCFHEMPLIHNS